MHRQKNFGHGAICKVPGQKKQSSRALEDLMHLAATRRNYHDLPPACDIMQEHFAHFKQMSVLFQKKIVGIVVFLAVRDEKHPKS